jgi:hypothetical protein
MNIDHKITNQFESQIVELFKDFYWLPGEIPILIGQLPNEILVEVEQFTEVCTKIKTHPLHFLKNHVNVGKNKFQVSVPNQLFEDSFTFAYIINLGSFFVAHLSEASLSQISRRVTVRRNHGHFDHYDFWINFIEKGDTNEWHNHAGSLSGVVYMDNSIKLPTLFEDGRQFCGGRGDIVLFPSHLRHMVDTNETDNTRITYAFNLNLSE